MLNEKNVLTTQTVSKAEQLTITENKLHEFEQRVCELQTADTTRQQILKAKQLATQTKYQNAMNIVAQTVGQISMLSEQLAAQKQECYRLEGTLEYIQSIPD